MENKEKMQIKDILKTLRTQAKISQKQLADALGIGQATVCQWEKGTSKPTCDAIIALTGGRNRITEAVNLLSHGRADRLFISGVDKDISLHDIQATQRFSVPRKDNIDIGHNASNTVENAQETTQWIKKNHIKSIRLVTSNYHILRSLTEFRRCNPDLKIILHPVYSENIEKKWWTSWQTFSLIFKEYNKFLYAYVRNLF